jgi:hypothetical protein
VVIRVCLFEKFVRVCNLFLDVAVLVATVVDLNEGHILEEVDVANFSLDDVKSCACLEVCDELVVLVRSDEFDLVVLYVLR